MTWRLSITAKLLLGFLALLILALGFLGTVSTLWFVREESANLDRFLVAEAQGISNRLEGIVQGLAQDGTLRSDDVRVALAADLKIYISQRLNRPIPYKTTLLVLDDVGVPLARSNTAVDLAGTAPEVALGEFKIDDVRDRGPAHRVVTGTFSLGPAARGTYRVASLLSSLDPPLASFLTSLVVLLGGSFVILTVFGVGLVRLTLSPVRRMALAAGTLSEENLGARIPVPPGNDDLSRLAETLNGLLKRLETDYAFQERLVEELTHQLKTPLTILRGRNEMSLTTGRLGGQGRELAEDNVADIDALVNLLNTLLRLARLDSRIDRVTTSPVDVKQTVEQLGEELEPLWISKDLEFRGEGDPVVVEADPEGFRQVMMNLYDNAWKFCPPGALVSTRWRADAEGVTLVVANQGAPIAEEDLERIFKRFYRSRNETVPGAGLGLSIVRSLVGLHGGRVRAYNPPEGGAAFELFWPYGSRR